MLRPTSTSAMSMDRISYAVPASKPLDSTVREIRSGFSSTCLCVSAEPTVVTMPSPTRAITVSSPAPPTRRSMFVRTVTRALARSSMPSFAIAATTGVSMTFGVTDICTASNTSRPARSIAQAFSNAIGMFARCAAIRALITRSTLPPARKCVSSWEMFSPRPALFALISGCTRRCGLMWRIFMPMSAPIDTCTPLDSAEIHSPSGTNDRNTQTTTNTTAIIPRIIAILPSMLQSS